MGKKLDRCVKKVRKNSPNVNPFAVCTVALKKKNNPKKDAVTKVLNWEA